VAHILQYLSLPPLSYPKIAYMILLNILSEALLPEDI
jgi:hypothetical protein